MASKMMNRRGQLVIFVILAIFIVGALIVAAPYIWPLIAPIMPSWLK